MNSFVVAKFLGKVVGAVEAVLQRCRVMIDVVIFALRVARFKILEGQMSCDTVISEPH